MLAPHIKKKVDKLWDRFWSAGLTNPLVAVEQITYLLFLKRLEDIDRKRIERGFSSLYTGHENCRWTYIRQEKTNPAHLIEVVFPWLRQLEQTLAEQSVQQPETEVLETEDQASELTSLNNRMADAYFQLDPNKGQVLSDAIDLIDQLFAQAGEGSAAQDVMGDTFEYLLSEIASAGKNGQFRTPRHIIRFMVELLDPQPGQRIIDPAAGTGGFLFSAQQYLLRKFTTPETLRIEWDGTPHRAYGDLATPEQDAAIHQGANFVGLDNDRTMARIGWMNLVLHGLDNPNLMQGDSLSKRDGKPKLAEVLEPESYDLVLANPPFTGTVDSADLEKDSKLFPRAGDRGKKKTEVITNKSELLFCWLMLDLLDLGGRCAVIVPEGVLFGNTDAHIKLRRELLTEHVVEAVISLPGGVFQPYTGVKTSIVIFRKETKRDAKQSFNGQAPRTKEVWFYEVEEDGFTLDAKRNPRPGGRNDLWDALEKFRTRARHLAEPEDVYYQPEYRAERWRQVASRDSANNLTPFGEAFSSLPEVGSFEGEVWGIHELFPELPAWPERAEQQIRTTQDAALLDLAIKHFSLSRQHTWDEIANATRNEQPSLLAAESEEVDKLLGLFIKDIRRAQDPFNRACRDAYRYFEPEESPGLPAWKAALARCQEAVIDHYRSLLRELPNTQITVWPSVENLEDAVNAIAKEFAKLDGFDVTLRSLNCELRTPLTTAKHWVVPVRAWALNDDWSSVDGILQGSHDAEGLVRPEYIQAMEIAGIYEDGALKEGFLDLDCIEARDWNLSASQYKPFDFTQLRSEKNVVELIGDLRQTEEKIIAGLDTLLAMVEVPA